MECYHRGCDNRRCPRCSCRPKGHGKRSCGGRSPPCSNSGYGHHVHKEDLPWLAHSRGLCRSGCCRSDCSPYGRGVDDADSSARGSC